MHFCTDQDPTDKALYSFSALADGHLRPFSVQPIVHWTPSKKNLV